MHLIAIEQRSAPTSRAFASGTLIAHLGRGNSVSLLVINPAVVCECYSRRLAPPINPNVKDRAHTRFYFHRWVRWLIRAYSAFGVALGLVLALARVPTYSILSRHHAALAVIRIVFGGGAVASVLLWRQVGLVGVEGARLAKRRPVTASGVRRLTLTEQSSPAMLGHQSDERRSAVVVRRCLCDARFERQRVQSGGSATMQQ